MSKTDRPPTLAVLIPIAMRLGFETIRWVPRAFGDWGLSLRDDHNDVAVIWRPTKLECRRLMHALLLGLREMESGK